MLHRWGYNRNSNHSCNNINYSKKEEESKERCGDVENCGEPPNSAGSPYKKDKDKTMDLMRLIVQRFYLELFIRELQFTLREKRMRERGIVPYPCTSNHERISALYDDGMQIIIIYPYSYTHTYYI